jgi:hypothetical protein|nr:MAG: hypothetical protein DIU57_11410 [Pseudomonadota bacterium]
MADVWHGPQVPVLEALGKAPKRPDEEEAPSRTAPRFVMLAAIRVVECRPVFGQNDERSKWAPDENGLR